MIGILEEDKISEDKYLQPDMNYKKEGYNSYTNNNNYYYLAGYPRNNERTVSSGQITEILEKPEFKHFLDDAGYNSGAPICLANNLFVIGIHKQGDNFKKINKGIFLFISMDCIFSNNFSLFPFFSSSFSRLSKIYPNKIPLSPCLWITTTNKLLAKQIGAPEL